MKWNRLSTKTARTLAFTGIAVAMTMALAQKASADYCSTPYGGTAVYSQYYNNTTATVTSAYFSCTGMGVYNYQGHAVAYTYIPVCPYCERDRLGRVHCQKRTAYITLPAKPTPPNHVACWPSNPPQPKEVVAWSW